MNLKDSLEIYGGGPGSGCDGPNCGRPKGHKGPHSPFTGKGIRKPKRDSNFDWAERQIRREDAEMEKRSAKNKSERQKISDYVDKYKKEHPRSKRKGQIGSKPPKGSKGSLGKEMESHSVLSRMGFQQLNNGEWVKGLKSGSFTVKQDGSWYHTSLSNNRTYGKSAKGLKEFIHYGMVPSSKEYK